MASGLSGIASLKEEREKDFQSNSLDFEPLEYSANYDSWHLQKIYPLVYPNVDQENCQHTFEIGSEHDNNYIDLREIYANVSFRVTTTDDIALTSADTNVSVVDNIDHSLFSSIDVFINGNLVSDHGKESSLRNYVTNLVSTSEQTKKTHLAANHWLFDKENARKTIDKDSFKDDDDNQEKQLTTRAKILTEEVHCYFQPQFDLMTCGKLLPAGNTLKLNFEMAHSDFLLLVPEATSPTDKSYKIRITSFTLEVKRCVPNKIALRHVEEAKKTRMCFPITRTTIRPFQVLQGQHTVTIPRIVDPVQLPYQLLVIPIENYQFKKQNQNPYIWDSCGIEKANLVLNGLSMPQAPLELSMRNRVYKFVMNALGHNELTGTSCGVSPYQWQNSKFFLAFDLAGCGCAGGHNHRPVSGDLQLHLTFKLAPKEPISLYVVACFENTISILDKTVTLDYTV